MKITMVSPLTMKENTLDLPITLEQLDLWQKGALVQQAMPHLNEEQKEFLTKGFYPSDFEKLWDMI